MASPAPVASSAAVDTYDEALGSEEWEEVPVHTVTIHDRTAGVTYTVDVPQVCP